ncbi:MAG: GC-type dockerin domain-anchored protein [Planctomycetota bacterium]
MTRTTAALAIAALAGVASAQSASVSFGASATTAAPGDTITVTLSVDPDTGGAGSGVFGPAGLYGFGGDVVLSGDAAGDVTSSSPAILAALASGATTSTAATPNVVRAGAGRGLDDALPAQITDLLSFDLTIDAGAADGQTFDIGFDGAIVLVENDSLETYATVPGINQNMLTASALTVTIGSGGCNAADIADPAGILDLSDIDAFIAAFLTSDSAADIAAPFGVVDLSDIDTFIALFFAGCP